MSAPGTQHFSAPPPRMITVDASTGDALVPVAPDVAYEFGKHPRTIKRWARDPKLKFPKLVAINGRLYASRKALEAWKAQMLATAIGTAA
jgi:hypothetical protein